MSITVIFGMSRIFYSPSSVKMPQRRAVEAHNEYGKAHKGFVVCGVCHNVSFKKQWRDPARLPNYEYEIFIRGIDVSLCPACDMAAKGLYEGEVMVEGLSDDQGVEFVNLVRAYNARSKRHDSQHRILALEKSATAYRVRTSENQMAVKLGKKIAQTFGHGEVSIKHSREPFEVERVRVTFHR